MRLGKALVGGIIGAAIGIALLFVVIRFSDGFWLAIPFAIITGFGVPYGGRAAGRASYFRGAIQFDDLLPPPVTTIRPLRPAASKQCRAV